MVGKHSQNVHFASMGEILLNIDSPPGTSGASFAAIYDEFTFLIISLLLFTMILQTGIHLCYYLQWFGMPECVCVVIYNDYATSCDPGLPPPAEAA